MLRLKIHTYQPAPPFREHQTAGAILYPYKNKGRGNKKADPDFGNMLVICQVCIINPKIIPTLHF